MMRAVTHLAIALLLMPVVLPTAGMAGSRALTERAKGTGTPGPGSPSEERQSEVEIPCGACATRRCKARPVRYAPAILSALPALRPIAAPIPVAASPFALCGELTARNGCGAPLRC